MVLSGHERADPGEAAGQIESGYVGPAARRILGPLSAIAFVLFLADSWVVLSRPLTPVDLAAALFIQGIDWGPLSWWMALTNSVAGNWQLLVGALAILAIAAIDVRGGWLMLIGSVASLLDNAIKQMVERHRPTPDLLHIAVPASGYSYPSGHAVFYTWLYFLAAFSLAPKFGRRGQPLVWLLAFILIALACVGRVWAGAHWPSDVLGGFLLALSWCSFVLWLPERWLPSPSRRWFLWRRRPAA